jgi:hypothetical protein
VVGRARGAHIVFFKKTRGHYQLKCIKDSGNNLTCAVFMSEERPHVKVVVGYDEILRDVQTKMAEMASVVGTPFEMVVVAARSVLFHQIGHPFDREDDQPDCTHPKHLKESEGVA